MGGCLGVDNLNWGRGRAVEEISMGKQDTLVRIQIQSWILYEEFLPKSG